MLIYMAVPVLIMTGLCIFSYMAGRYVRIGKKREEVKAPEIIKTPELPKEPDRVPILEEEIRSLKIALDLKDKELEERSNAAELIMQENQRLLAQARQDNVDNADKTDERKEETEDAIKIDPNLLQPEREAAASNIPFLPISSLCEDVPREPAIKMKREEPGKKLERKKPGKKAARKSGRKKI